MKRRHKNKGVHYWLSGREGVSILARMYPGRSARYYARRSDTRVEQVIEWLDADSGLTRSTEESEFGIRVYFTPIKPLRDRVADAIADDPTLVDDLGEVEAYEIARRLDVSVVRVAAELQAIGPEILAERRASEALQIGGSE